MTEHRHAKPPHPDRLSDLWRRVFERKVVQWSAAYIAIAYGLQHGVVLTSEAFEWPHEVARYSMLALALGLPIATVVAWYHGEPVGRRISGPELTVIALLLVIASLLFYVFVRPSGEFSEGAPALFGVVSVLLLTGALLFVLVLRPPSDSNSVSARTQSVPPTRLTASPPTSGISLAVLPFLNLSRDPDQEFFSDGMTEEITAALAQIKGLRVVGRTSAFQFKDENKDLGSIGRALGATHLIEGSVRRVNNRVRITAQLIHAEDDAHLWAQSYDRELTDIFAVQEDIAQAIAAALHIPLGLKQGEVLVGSRTADLGFYQNYLRGRALVRARGSNIAQAIATLEPLVAHDPCFAPAWALLAYAYYLLPAYGAVARTGSLEEARLVVQSSYQKAEAAARRSMTLEPKHAGGYAALAAVQTQRGKWVEADGLFRKALVLDPGEPDGLYDFSLFLATTGQLQQSLKIDEMLRTLEPFVPNFNLSTAGHMLMNREAQAAIALLESIPADAAGGYFRNMTLASAYAAEGRYAEAADTLLCIPQPNVVSRRSVEDAARLIRTPTQAGAAGELPVLEGGLNFVYAYIGAQERLMEFPERLFEVTGGGTTASIWFPAYAAVRKTERFKAHIRAVKLIDYWRTRSWPDLCHPIGADDFACD